MKKLMISLCALCFAGAVNAQVSKLPVSEKVQKFSQVYKTQILEKQDVQTMQGRKAEVEYDSVAPQSYYGWEGYGLISYFKYTEDQEFKNGYCGEDVILWAYGTGGLITWTGSGEIGYRFFAGRRSYYNVENMYPNYGVPYAVNARIYRAPSTSRRNSDGEYDSMPLYFKLYDHTKVGEQEVLASITKYGPEGGVNVVYPTDPEKYTTLSETVMVPAGCKNDDSGKPFYPLTSNHKAEFKNVDASQRLGDDFCVSMMFPIDWDEEGDSIVEPTTWNACPVIMCQENLESVISERPHSVYCVFDFERTSYWVERPEDGKRFEGMVGDSIMQPNMRYAIVPMDSWYGNNGSNLDGEPWFYLYYTDWTSLQSANKADRYIQLSPVPATDYVNFTSYADMSRIEIYSLGGQLVKAVNVSGETYRMDLTGMNSGMYVARVYSEKGISSKKLIVR